MLVWVSVRAEGVYERNMFSIVEQTSIRDTQTLVARAECSEKDMGESVMAGGAREAYASFAT